MNDLEGEMKKMVYRFSKPVLCFILLFGLSVQPLFAAEKTVKIKVTLSNVELIENNHVGNEWLTEGSVNGKEIDEGSTVVLNLKASDTIALKAYAEEQDKIPDIGTSTTSIKVSKVTKKTTKSIKVKVVENRGRYSGESATWKFDFVIEKA
ncbi:hypothetical protein [Paenibacillus baekrokdamisoli]|nr:hypothetical protein [Paenibacillus baekrokdamisoli]